MSVTAFFSIMCRWYGILIPHLHSKVYT